MPCIKSLSFNNICTFNSSHAFQHYVFLIINNIFSLMVCAQFSSKFWRVCREMCAHGSKGEEGGGGWWEVGGGGGGDVGSRLCNLRIFPRPLSSHSPLVKGWFYPWIVLLLSYRALTSDNFEQDVKEGCFPSTVPTRLLFFFYVLFSKLVLIVMQVL